MVTGSLALSSRYHCSSKTNFTSSSSRSPKQKLYYAGDNFYKKNTQRWSLMLDDFLNKMAPAPTKEAPTLTKKHLGEEWPEQIQSMLWVYRRHQLLHQSKATTGPFTCESGKECYQRKEGGNELSVEVSKTYRRRPANGRNLVWIHFQTLSGDNIPKELLKAAILSELL